MSKIRVKHVIAVIVFIIFISLFSTKAFSADIDLKVFFDKDKYTKDDQIKVKFKLENNSEKEFYVNNRFYINSKKSKKNEREVYLKVISPESKILPCKVSYVPGLPRTDNFILLKPGEAASVDRERNIKHYFDFSNPGIYKIKVVYQNTYGREIGLSVYKEKIFSKETKIEITK